MKHDSNNYYIHSAVSSADSASDTTNPYLQNQFLKNEILRLWSLHKEQKALVGELLLRR